MNVIKINLKCTIIFFFTSLLYFYFIGAIWPIEAQSKLLKLFSEALPVRIVSQSMTEISLKGWTIDHPSIINAVLFLFGYIGFLVIFLIVLGKFKKDMWVLRK